MNVDDLVRNTLLRGFEQRGKLGKGNPPGPCAAECDTAAAFYGAVQHLGTGELSMMKEISEMRAYDRFLQCAAEQMAAVSPLPDLTVAAQDAGVSLAEAHAWFADNHALSVAVVEQQMMLLTDHLARRASAATPDDTVAQLRALTHAYVEWFFDHPVGGRLLVSPAAVAILSEHQVRRFSSAIYDLAQSMMERARDAGLIKADVDIAEVLLTMRALTLGIVVLQDMDHARLWGNPDDPREALTRVMNSYFDLAMQRPDAGAD